jgi:hypothetical protein
LQSHGLTSSKEYKSLKTVDIAYIEKHAGVIPDTEIARELGCSSMIVGIYRKKMDL